MFIDFSFYLLLAVVSLSIFLAGWSWWQRLRPGRPTPLAIVYARELFPVVLLVFVLRSFVVEPFRIPSGSMLPNLHDGDLILVTKYDYGIRAPVSNRIMIETGQPQRGDIVVFYHPEKTDLHYIKRLVGLPGDHIRIAAGRVYVGSRLLSQAGLSADAGDASVTSALKRTKEQMREQMPRQYRALDFRLEMAESGRRWITMHHSVAANLTQEFIVPPGHYFVLGDNRDRSNDSRYWGFVPEHHIAGKARLIWLHLDWNFWTRTGFIDTITDSEIPPQSPATASETALEAGPNPEKP